MAKKKLTCSITLRKSSADFPETFQAGELLPDWAEARVGGSAHLFETSDPEDFVVTDKIPKPSEREEDDSDSPEVEVITNHDEDHRSDSPELEVPSRAASKVAWTAFAQKAKELGADIELDGSEDRDALIAKVEEAGVIPPKES